MSYRSQGWIVDISEKILSQTSVDEIRKAVLLQLEPIFKAHKSNFFLAESSDNRLIVRDVVARGVEEKYHDYFREHYYKTDPFVNAINVLSSLPSKVCTTDQLVPYEEYVRTEFYNEFIRPQDIYAELVIYLTSGIRLLGLVSFFRPRNRPVFSEKDRVNARRVAPYITAALERALAMEDAVQKDVAMKSILSGIPHKGIILMDQHLEPFYVSESARRILSLLPGQGACREKTGFAMPPQLYLWLEQCKNVLSMVKYPESENQQFDFVTKDKARDISASLRLVNSLRQRPFLVLMIESQAPEPSLTQCLRGTGLSKRETDVALLAWEGLSNAQIAKKLFISEYTVINHLRSIYEKTHVDNRTGLAHYVASLLLRPSGASPHLPSAPQ